MEVQKTFYRKLIRDYVPKKMESLGVAFEVRTLDVEEFRTELLKKVEEEASGVPQATTREELIGELADTLDVIEEIQRLEHIQTEEILEAQQKNAEKKGGFLERIFLEWSADNGYKTNEKKNG